MSMPEWPRPLNDPWRVQTDNSWEILITVHLHWWRTSVPTFRWNFLVTQNRCHTVNIDCPIFINRWVGFFSKLWKHFPYFSFLYFELFPSGVTASIFLHRTATAASCSHTSANFMSSFTTPINPLFALLLDLQPTSSVPSILLALCSTKLY